MDDDLSVEGVVTTTDLKVNEAAVSQAAEEVVASDTDENLLASDVENAPDNDLAVDEPASEEAQETADEDEPSDEEEVEAAEEDEQADEKPKAEKPKGSRADKRIQSLNKRAKDAEERLQSMQAQYQQQFNYLQQQMAQQMEAQKQAYQAQLEYAKQQADIVRQRQEAEELAKLTPAQRLEREWIMKAQQSAESALMPKFQALERKLAQEQQMRAQITESVKRRNELQVYKTNAGETANKVLFSGLDPEVVPKLAPRIQEVLMTWDTAFGGGLDKSALEVKEAFEAYHQAKLKSVSKKAGAKIKQSQAAPKPLPTGKVSAKGDARPSPQELQKMGFQNYMQWRSSRA
jgi:hypothetical protein